MRFSLLTRSSNSDYVFVGRRHVDRWWGRGDFQRLFSADKPSIAVRREADDTQVLLAGLPSDRKDSHGRRIRFSVLIEYESEESAESLDTVVGFIQEWLKGPWSGDDVGGEIGVRFSSVFSEKTIENWFVGGDSSRAASDDPKLALDVSDQIHSVANLSSYSPAARNVLFKRWIGGLANARARGAFLAAVEELLRGRADVRGAAIVASLFVDRQELREQLERLEELNTGSLAVLISDDQEAEEIRPKVSGSGNPSDTEEPKNAGWNVQQHLPWGFLLVATLALILVVMMNKC